MLYRVETGLHAGLDDTQGRKTAQHLLKALNLSTGSVRQIKVFTAEGLSEAQVRRLLDEGIWHDPILQAASLEPLPAGQPEPDWYVEVGFRPGVTDNEARTARDTAAMVLDIPRDSLRVYTAVQHRIVNDPAAPLTREQVDMLARDLLCNTLIQRYRIKSREEWQASPGFEAQAAQVTGEANDTVDTITLSGMSDDDLTQASRANTWALNLKEMHSIREQFTAPDEVARRKALSLPGDPTDVEMEVLAQTWSEHCKHKIFAANIEYENKETGKREIYIAQDGSHINQWGVLQYYEKLDSKANAKAMADALLDLYNTKTRTLKLQDVLGDIRVRAGTLLVVMLGLGDINVSNYLMAEQVKHTFNDGQHLMELKMRGGTFVA